MGELDLPDLPNKAFVKRHNMHPTPDPTDGEDDAHADPKDPPPPPQATPEIATPDSSPERGGVRLSPAKPSLNAEILRTTILPQISVERSMQHNNDDASEHEHPRSPSATGSQSIDSRGLSHSNRSGLRHRSWTGSGRRAPLRLPQHFFQDESRSVSAPERSRQRTTLDGTALDGPVLLPSPTRGENYPPPTSAVYSPDPTIEDQPQEPPAYQPRPLTVPHRRSRPEGLYRSLPFPALRHRLGHWLRLVFLDLLFMFVFLAVTGGLLLWGGLWHWRDRVFPMTFDQYTGTWYGPVELSYPRHDFYIGITFIGVLIPLIPLLVIALMQFWIRSMLDLNAAFFALKKAMVLMLFLQTILKSYIGELRPFFISTCNPDPVRLNTLRQFLPAGAYPRVFATPTVCRVNPRQSAAQNFKDLIFAMTSFPSGHTANSFMAGTFLALYLNAKLKPFGDYHTSFWKMVGVVGPVIGAMFVAGSLVADRNHHPHDIILSIPIGVLLALLSYRTHYASIFDYRTNHLPLPWSGAHESLNPTVPNFQESSSDQQNNTHRQPLRNRRNFVATPWPRKPKTYSFGGNAGEENGTVRRAQGLDGTADRAVVSIGRHVSRPRVGFVTKGKMRMALFLRPGEVKHRSLVARSGESRPSAREVFEMTPAVDADGGGIDLRLCGRRGVDEWLADTARSVGRSRGGTGRPSDMV